MRTKEMQVELPEEITTFFKTYILYFLVILNIDPSQMGYLLGMIFLDTISGIIKSIRLKDPLSFSKFIWGMLSKLGILIIPFVIAAFAMLFKVDLFYLVQAFIYIIAVNDLISFITNIASIRSGKRYKNVDFVEKGIHYLMETFEKNANKVIDKIKKINEALNQDSDKTKPESEE